MVVGAVEGVDQLVPFPDAGVDEDETIGMLDQVREDRDVAVRPGQRRIGVIVRQVQPRNPHAANVPGGQAERTAD